MTEQRRDIDAQTIRRTVLAFFAERLKKPLSALEAAPDSFSFATDGELDSLGFVELLTHVEDSLGLEIDFAGMNPDDFGTLGGFVRATVPAK